MSAEAFVTAFTAYINKLNTLVKKPLIADLTVEAPADSAPSAQATKNYADNLAVDTRTPLLYEEVILPANSEITRDLATLIANGSTYDFRSCSIDLKYLDTAVSAYKSDATILSFQVTQAGAMLVKNLSATDQTVVIKVSKPIPV